MIATKLILIDGMTGSGKSTTAQRLWLHLPRHGHAARWFYEHDTAHPIWRPGEQARCVEVGFLEQDLLAEKLPGRWRALAADCARTEQVTILEGALFQSTVGFLLAMRTEDGIIAEHVVAVAEIVARAAPALVYLRQRDVARLLQAAFEDRSADDYAAALIAHVGATPYGRATELHDIAGLVRFYEAWRALVDVLFGRLPLRKLAIDADIGDWPSRERQLTGFLGLPEMHEEVVRIERPARFRGRYADARSGDALVVAGDERGLYLDDARRTRLIPAGNDSFHLASMCADLRFADERGGRFRRLELYGNLPGLSPLWLRTGSER